MNYTMRKGPGKEISGKVLDGWVDYPKIRFAHEEKFSAQTNYPDATAHKKSTTTHYLSKCWKYRKSIRAGRPSHSLSKL